MSFTGTKLAHQRTLSFSAMWLAWSYLRGAKKSQLFFTSPGNAHDSYPSVSMQPPARTCPVASKENALRPSGTTPAPVSPDSMDQNVNMVRPLFCWYYCGHWSCAGSGARKQTVLETLQWIMASPGSLYGLSFGPTSIVPRHMLWVKHFIRTFAQKILKGKRET